MGSSTGTKREKAMKESTLAISLLCLGCFLSIDKVHGYSYEPSGSCPASYVYVAGDIPGNGLGAFRSANIANCAKRCDAKSNCGSFEYSPRRKHCNLNSESKPTTGVYQDFDFCVKKEDSMAKEVEALKNNMVKKTELQENMDSMAKEVEALKNNMAKEVEALKNNMAKEVKALKNNTVKKTELQENMDSTAKEVEELKKKMVKKTELQENMDRLSRLEKLSQRGAYCGYQRSWTIAYRVITYQKLMLSEGDAGVLDPNTGVFRASVPGLFQINWSLRNYLKGNDDNLIYLHRNRRVIDESEHYSYITRTASSSQVIGEMGGRTMLLRLGAGDTLYLRTSNFQGGAIRIQFCVMLLAAE